MTCKDCICYEKCKGSRLDFVDSAEPTRVCQHFKNKVDVVEVVRCKDCQYWDAVKNPKHKGVGICKPSDEALYKGYCAKRGATRENDYCSHGVRGTREEYLKSLCNEGAE